jgi:hypothetical protein
VWMLLGESRRQNCHYTAEERVIMLAGCSRATMVE